MKSLVCQAQHLELNPLLYGQPMKLSKDWGEMFISPSIGYYPSGSVLYSLNALKLALCNTIQNGVVRCSVGKSRILSGMNLFTMVIKVLSKLFAISCGSVSFLSPSIILVGTCLHSLGAFSSKYCQNILLV